MSIAHLDEIKEDSQSKTPKKCTNVTKTGTLDKNADHT